MSEEELLKKQWKEQENLKPTIFYSEDYVKELQERIDRAIEHIVHPTFKGTHSTNEEVLVDVLRILKGEDKK